MNTSLYATWQAWQTGNTAMLPVYICQRVADEVVAALAARVPDEGIVKLFGHDAEHDGQLYATVTDWFAGESQVTPVTATFTDAGLREIELARAARYPDRDSRPVELGVAHSHPFGHNPSFSGVDRNTFCHFPYGADNVHILADPTDGWFKVFVTWRKPDGRVDLQQVPWGCYAPAVGGQP